MQLAQDMTALTGSGSDPAEADLPIVIVGAGPVGIRVLRELQQAQPELPVVVYGDEARAPYNRVQLSGLLAGQVNFADIAIATDLLQRRGAPVRFVHRRVARIDRVNCTLVDEFGDIQPYRRLVLATGSRPFVPGIPGMDLPGVYTFRNLADAEQLAARRARSQRTVVLGGGLLGIEAARAMQRFNTGVALVEHNAHPMFRQLDSAAGAMVAEELRRLGIDLWLGSGLRMLVGSARLEGLVLRDGTELPCDSLIVATGIRPNLDLAVESGLAYGRGIRVDAHMQTSDPQVYAVGECCEFDGQVYGLVAPGFEQAAIAARHVLHRDEPRTYGGTQLATSLKVAGLSVFSMGEVDPDPGMNSVVWRSGDSYRRLILSRGRLRGLIAVGDWSQLPRLRDLGQAGAYIPPWQLLRFRLKGDLFSPDAASAVASWPDSSIVCNCNAVSVGEIRGQIAAGCTTETSLALRCQAGNNCGSCRPLLQELLGDAAPRSAVRTWRSLAAISIAALAMVLVALLSSVPYPESVQWPWRWDMLWRSSDLKQISGFSVLGLTALGLMVTLRKRLRWFRFGDFNFWRLGHVLLGLLALTALGVHTGFRPGDHLNSVLMACFLGLALLGTVMGLAIGTEHRMQPARARRLRRVGQWGHLLLSWPVPVLLGFHILKTYYF